MILLMNFYHMFRRMITFYYVETWSQERLFSNNHAVNRITIKIAKMYISKNGLLGFRDFITHLNLRHASKNRNI